MKNELYKRKKQETFWTLNPVQHFFLNFFHWHSVLFYCMTSYSRWYYVVSFIFIRNRHYFSHGWSSPSNLPKRKTQREKGEAPTTCSSGFYKSQGFQTNHNPFYHQLCQELLSFLCIVYFPLDWLAEFKYLELFYFCYFLIRHPKLHAQYGLSSFLLNTI